MLNPDEAEHQKALRKMSSISQRARRLFADPRAHFDADDTTSSDKLDLIARSILKKEWDRLRREI
jgi:hypothetical protein